MKTRSFLFSITIVCLLSVAVSPARAEGWFHFANNSQTRVYERDYFTFELTLVPTNGGKVELLYAPVGTTDLSLFQPMVGKSPVTIAPVPGAFFGGTYRLTDIAPAATIAAVVRGWTGLHNSWEEAITSSTAKVGISEIFLIATTDPTLVPAPVPPSIVSSVPGQGFNGLILGIPEPASATLFALGATCLLFLRRRQ